LANFRQLARAGKLGALNRVKDLQQVSALAKNHLGAAMNLLNAELGARVSSHQRLLKAVMSDEHDCRFSIADGRLSKIENRQSTIGKFLTRH
jgi:hypothetical protein